MAKNKKASGPKPGVASATSRKTDAAQAPLRFLQGVIAGERAVLAAARKVLEGLAVTHPLGEQATQGLAEFVAAQEQLDQLLQLGAAQLEAGLV